MRVPVALISVWYGLPSWSCVVTKADEAVRRREVDTLYVAPSVTTYESENCNALLDDDG